ncbi:hypothetical protein AVEN_168051-1 [Araneus ventricosus]|uniref:Uncharacterized protein n=1 Tax=Araneus ventricosus TaxID=182803 RepID=A0A4Y2VER5_ARAVE|nr:hypothetical protein AVEN_168051-1 [Araneus ventricosus]
MQTSSSTLLRPSSSPPLRLVVRHLRPGRQFHTDHHAAAAHVLPPPLTARAPSQSSYHNFHQCAMLVLITTSAPSACGVTAAPLTLQPQVPLGSTSRIWTTNHKTAVRFVDKAGDGKARNCPVSDGHSISARTQSLHGGVCVSTILGLLFRENVDFGYTKPPASCLENHHCSLSRRYSAFNIHKALVLNCYCRYSI